MAYVPPHMRAGYTAEQRPNPFGNDRRRQEREERERRRQEAEERGREIARRQREEEEKYRLPEVTENNFPALGGGGAAKKVTAVGSVSFAEQALRWKEQREKDEYEQKVKAEYDRMIAERKAQEKFAMDIALARMPGAPPKVHVPVPRKTIVREAPVGVQQQDDDWVTYEDPKKKKQREALAMRDQKRMEALLRDPSPEDAEEDEDQDMWGGEEHHEEW